MSLASNIFELFTLHWQSAILASAVELDVFEHLERGCCTVAELHDLTGVPERSLQALLDALVVANLVTTNDSVRYESTQAATKHLIRGKPGYLGTFAHILTGSGDGGMRQWSMLTRALRDGKPLAPESIVEPDNPFWPALVEALTPLSCEVAAIAADLVGLQDGKPTSILDLGGGAGAYSQVWLALNPRARVVQIDWAPVNRLARERIDALGLGDRFTTLDGDLQALPFDTMAYDLVVVSNICHHQSARANVALLAKIAGALAANGRVVVSDFVLHDDRRGPAFAARFGAGMILQTPEGASYRERDYQDWLLAAGFETAHVDRSHPLSTLLIARVRPR